MDTIRYQLWKYRCALNKGGSLAITVFAKNEDDAMFIARQACKKILRRLGTVSLKETVEPINPLE